MEAVLKNDNLIWINGAGKGYRTSHRYTFVPIPDQDVSSLFEWEGTLEDGGWIFMGTLKDLTFYASEDKYPKTMEQRVATLEADVIDLKAEREARNEL